tara:strand:+ start:1746 stop:1928 length:183 start_codon:yes stop_codon:yes gene_type:complete
MKDYEFLWSRTDTFGLTVRAETEEEARKIFDKGEQYDVDVDINCGDDFGLELIDEREVAS